MKLEVQWFLQHGCELASPMPILLIGIYQAENGDPCRRCNCKQTCPAWPLAQAEQRKSEKR